MFEMFFEEARSGLQSALGDEAAQNAAAALVAGVLALIAAVFAGALWGPAILVVAGLDGGELEADGGEETARAARLLLDRGRGGVDVDVDRDGGRADLVEGHVGDDAIGEGEGGTMMAARHSLG